MLVFGWWAFGHACLIMFGWFGCRSTGCGRAWEGPVAPLREASSSSRAPCGCIGRSSFMRRRQSRWGGQERAVRHPAMKQIVHDIGHFTSPCLPDCVWVVRLLACVLGFGGEGGAGPGRARIFVHPHPHVPSDRTREEASDPKRQTPLLDPRFARAVRHNHEI